MEAKFLTPIQLWKDFNPVKEPLELNYISSCITENGFIRKGVYYTSETVPDGKARVYAEIVAENDSKKKPVAVIVGDFRENINIGLLEYVAGCGYIAASLDYSGVTDNDRNFTHYPSSLSYANYANAAGNLNRAEPSAADTCWFVWAKAARRLISVLEKDSQADTNNIGIIGIKHGALIMWQLAAMDGRVRAAASLIGNESMLYQGKYKFATVEELELDESRVNWRAALSSEAYARFISCPVMIAAASNNNYSSIDRIEDIIYLLPESVQYSLVIAPRMNNQLTENILGTVRKWFNNCLKKVADFPKNPALSYKAADNKVAITVKPDESRRIKDVILYYSAGETDVSFRNWYKADTIKGEDAYSINIDIYYPEVRHFVFANVNYADGIEISTLEYSFMPKELGVSGIAAVKQRIIYDSSKGTDTFFVKSRDLVIYGENPHIEKCPAGINGITASEGALVSYKLGDLRCLKDEDAILQLNASSKTDRNIEILLTAVEDGLTKRYTAQSPISGSQEWYKLSFSPQDFKTTELIPLKNWQNVKRMEIKDVKGVLFNNIIWV